MKKTIIGNWKMNPSSLEEARRIYRSVRLAAGKLSSVNVVLCPPFVYVPALLNTRSESRIAIGAQNVYYEDQGAFTGEVSVGMLKNIGATHVIVGHSERRAQGETDDMVARKVQATLEAGLHPVLCVGEKERNDHGDHLDFLKGQLKGSLAKVPKRLVGNLIVAYEPLWAIGAKEAMKPEDVYEMSLFIKKVLADLYGHDEAVSTPVLYGGSVNFRNAPDIVIKGQVDGLLVGRESVNSAGFVELIKAIDAL